MQLVDSKLYIANAPSLDAAKLEARSLEVSAIGAARRDIPPVAAETRGPTATLYPCLRRPAPRRDCSR